MAKSKKIEKYQVILSTSGVDYKAEGLSIDEALEKLGMTWDKIKAKGVFKVSFGNLYCERLYGLNPLRRIFASKIVRFQTAKQLGLFLKEKEAATKSG